VKVPSKTELKASNRVFKPWAGKKLSIDSTSYKKTKIGNSELKQ